MKYLKDVLGKKVVDVNEKEMGVLEDLEISISEDEVFLRVAGDALKEIRGRSREFLPIREIDQIDEKVHLYKTLDGLKEIIGKVVMSTTPSFRCTNLVGKTVTSNDEEVGEVVDFRLDQQANQVTMVVEGSRIRQSLGKKRQEIEVFQISEITDKIRLQHDFETLTKRIEEKKTGI